LDGQIWALKADSLTSPLIVAVTVTDLIEDLGYVKEITDTNY